MTEKGDLQPAFFLKTAQIRHFMRKMLKKGNLKGDLFCIDRRADRKVEPEFKNAHYGCRINRETTNSIKIYRKTIKMC